MSDKLAPFARWPGLVERQTKYVDLMLRDEPDISGWRIWLAKTLNDAYGDLDTSGVGGTLASAHSIEVNRSGFFRSDTIRQRGILLTETTRGMARVLYDPDDFVVAANPQPFPTDQEVAYLRVQQKRQATGNFLTVAGVTNNGDAIMGPILVAPSAKWFGQPRPILTLTGTAPSNTGCVSGSVPKVDVTVQTPLPMHIVLPRRTHTVGIQNEDAAGDLLVSFGLDQEMTLIPNGKQELFYSGGAREIVLARKTGNGGCAFSINAVVALGPE